MNFSQLSDDQLLLDLAHHFENERKISHLILLHLKVVWQRKLYADRGYPSLFEMLIKHFRLSETSAHQRIQALKLLIDVPEAEEKLVNGDVNLSTLAMAQRQIHREEKVTGEKLDQDKKSEIVDRISGKTMAQAEVELMQMMPEAAASEAQRTHERRVSAEAVRLSLNVPDRLREKLKRLQEVWAHVNPEMDYVEVIERAVDIALEKVDPLRKAEKRAQRQERKQAGQQAQKSSRQSPPEKQRTTVEVAQTAKVASEPASENAKAQCKTPPGQRPNYYSTKTDDIVWTRAGGQCEWVDEKTGRRCECRFGSQRDHITPLALGGSNEPENLRLLCHTHNQLMARRYSLVRNRGWEVRT